MQQHILDGELKSAEEQPYNDFTSLGGERVIEQAEAEGFKVYRSDPLHLLLDLDTPAAVEQFERVWPRLNEAYVFTGIERWKSKSGNTHVYITLADQLPVMTRLAMQAALGSDGMRELLGVLRALNGVEEPSLLFRPTGEVLG